MENLFTLIFILLLLYIITYVFTKIKTSFFNRFNDSNKNTISDIDNTIVSYSNKNFMTPSEHEFYNKMIELETEYNIVPQVCLASVVNKTGNSRYQSQLYRIIDFGIFTKDYKKLLLLIELNDNTHKTYNRRDRDLKVKKICNDANIEIITFYSCYPNEKDYVLKRILQSILKQNQ